jgi:SAM-dependent methyltransferase
MDIAGEKTCALCGGRARMTCKGMKGYVEGSSYDVYECSHCLSSFINLVGDLGKEYNAIYGTDPTQNAGYRYYHYLAHASKQLRTPLHDLAEFSAVFWGVRKALRDVGVGKGAKLLEVGSGLGYFTHALNKAGYVASGLEYSPTAVEFARRFFGEQHAQGTIEEFAEEHAEEFDAVIATEVIEHVIDPVMFVGKGLQALKPGGKLILTTPIKDIHPEGTIWETEPAPVHLWWFTEKGIEAIARRFSANVSFVDFTEYTTCKVWHVHIGQPHVPPSVGPLVRTDGTPYTPLRKGYRERLMAVLPAWMYVKLVALYHAMKFLQRGKPPSRYMYGMCAVIEKR